jgi:hypothetical protein
LLGQYPEWEQDRDAISNALEALFDSGENYVYSNGGEREEEGDDFGYYFPKNQRIPGNQMQSYLESVGFCQ